MKNFILKRSFLSASVIIGLGISTQAHSGITGPFGPFNEVFSGIPIEVSNTTSGTELWIVNDERAAVDENYALFITDNGGIDLGDNGNREEKVQYNNIFAFASNNSDTASIILGSGSSTASPYFNADSVGVYSNQNGIQVNNGNLTLKNSHISALETAIVIDNSAGGQSKVDLSDITIKYTPEDFDHIFKEYLYTTTPVGGTEGRIGLDIIGNSSADKTKQTTVTGKNITIDSRYLALVIGKGAQGDFNNLNITTTKTDQPTIEASGENTILKISNSTINSSSTGVEAIGTGDSAKQSAKVVLNHSVINRNSSRFGLLARKGGIIEANDVDINLKGGPGGSAGFSFAAVAVRDEGTLAELNNVRINDSLDNSPSGMIGIYADSGAKVNADNVKLTSNSAGGEGIRLHQEKTVVNLKNSQFDITGNKASAVGMLSGTLNVENSLIKATDYIISIGNVEDLPANNINIKNSTLATDNMLLRGGPNVEVNFTADNSQLSGRIQSQGGFPGSGHSSITLANNTTWSFGALSTMNELHLDNSLVRMLKPVNDAFNRLEVDTLTSKNGVIELWTVFAGDDSKSDQVLVNESATGQTGLRFRKAGGEGALTKNGILIVDAADNSGFGGPKATTTTDAFHIDGGSDGYRQGYGTIVSGAYEYTLTRGADISKNESNWYLTSLKKKDEIVPPILPPKVIRPPEISMYFANAQAARDMQRHKWQDRAGSRINADDTDGSPVAWARIVADTSSFKDEFGDKRKTNTQVLHLGSDVYRHNFSNNSRITLGAMALIGKASSKITVSSQDAKGNVSTRNGNGDVNSYNIGTYATWQQDPQSAAGAYVDTWLLQGWSRNEVSGSGQDKDKYNSGNLSLSVEAGYSQPIYEAENIRWTVQPQAQIIWSKSSTSDYTRKANKDKVVWDDESQFTTRIGARLAGDIKAESGVIFRPFTELNYLRYPDSQTIQFGADRAKDKMPKSAVGMSLGLQANMNDNILIRAEVQGEKGNMDYSNLGGQLGITYKW